MRFRPFAAPGLVACLALAGCSDRETQTPAEPEFSHTASASCDFNFNSLVSQFFVQPRQGVVAGLKTQMEAAHTASSETDVQARGFDILAHIEAAVNLKESSNSTAGSDLANRLLACMFTEAQLSPVALPVDFTQELTVSGLGAFGVRGGATSYDTAGPVLAHDGFSGVTPVSGAPWSTVLSNRILIYGERASSTTESYDWFKILRSTTFNSPFVIVGLCVPSGSADMLVQNGSAVLAFDGTHFLPCSATIGLRSRERTPGWGPFELAQRLVRLFAPSSLHAAAMFTNTTSGKAGSFSNFRSDAIDAMASDYLTAPPTAFRANVVVTPTITVKVTADDGKPAVNLLVTLVVASTISNKGSKVGVAGETAITNSEGIATFPSFLVKKPGTYTLQAFFELGRPGVDVTFDQVTGIQVSGPS
jgi:hypothetical protein